MINEIEHQVFLLSQQGKSAKEIALALSCCINTIYKYRRSYLAKLSIPLSSIEVKNILTYKLYLSGMPISDILRFLKIERSSFYRIINKYKNENITLDFKLSYTGILI